MLLNAYNKLFPAQKEIIKLTLALVATALFAPFVVVVLYLIYQQREAYYADINKILPSAPFLLGLMFLALPLVWAISGQFPLDDGWRHLTAWQHGYQYLSIYFEVVPGFPTHSMWIGYEIATSYLTKLVGLNAAVCILQAVYVILAAWALWRAVAMRVDGDDKLFVFTILYFLLLASGLGLRLLMVRPEAIWLIMIIAAFSMRWWAWVLLASLLQPIYWLGIIYAPVVLLLNTSLRNRLIGFAIICISSVVFWVSFSGSEWFNLFIQIREWLETRLFDATENQKMTTSMLFSPYIMLLAFMATASVVKNWHRNMIPVILVIVWFLAPNQIRYAPTICIILGVLALPELRALLEKYKQFKVLILIACFLGATNVTDGTSTFESLPEFNSLKPGDNVITSWDASTQLLPARTIGVKVAPPMEGGAATMIMQRVIKDSVDTQTFNCELASQTAYTHFAEVHMRKIPDCLALQEISGRWRLWKRIK